MPEPFPPPRSASSADRAAERIRAHVASTFSSVVHPRRWTRPSIPARSVLRVELLAGLVVALALIPEAISFSIIAGVDPKIGLYASFTMAVAIAFTGVDRCLDPDGTTCIYSVTGELFFASDQEFIDAFDYGADPPRVIIDMSRAHVWDASAVAALDAIETHYARHDVAVEITGLNRQSHELHTTLTRQTAGAHR